MMKGRSSASARRAAISVGVALALSILAAPAAAVEYPTHPIKLIVPFPPGGSDSVARLFAEKLGAQLKQPVVVENHAGAAGVIGTQLGAQAPADGYTLTFITSSLTITPPTAKLSYDLNRDFAPVAPLSSAPMLLVIHPSVAVRSPMELIALAKSKPSSLNFASTGTGSITHLAAELFCADAGISMAHIPFKGTGPAQSELLSGRVQVMFGILGPALPFVRAGKLSALGVTSAKRTSLAPELPTIAEAGLRGYEAETWYGILAPAKTPESILKLLHGEISQLTRAHDVVLPLANSGFEPITYKTRAEFGRYIESERIKWSELIKRQSISLE